MMAFANGVYQTPRSICTHHHMLLPRMIRSQIVKKGIIRYIDVHDINQRPLLEVLIGELEKLIQGE
jgi:hypothetical protein